MPESDSPTPQPKPKRGWGRRLFRGMLWALLALVVLHRPLIHYGGPLVVRMLAKRQHLDVSLELSGSIFTNLTVTNVRATPNGTGPSPVERIKIDSLHFDYDLMKLWRNGVGEFLANYELRHADLAFVALPSKTQEEKKAKKSIAETLRTVLGQPATYSDRVEIEDFNLTVRSPTAETRIRGLDALFDPKKTGHFRMAQLAIPGLPVWEKLSAETSYVNRNLYQRGLRLSPDLVIDELNFDASRRAEGKGLLGLKASIFGGHAALHLSGEETGAAGEHLEKQYVTHLKVAMRDVRVREAAAYFGAKRVPLEKLTQFDLDFTGDPEKPRTWNGTASAHGEKIAAGALTIPQVQSVATFANGNATLKTNAQIGDNVAQIDAKVDLPADVADFIAAGVDAKVELLARDPSAIVTPFAKEAKSSGALLGGGTIKMRDRHATAQLEFSAKDIVFNDAGAALVGLRLDASKALDDKTPLGGLEATLALEAQQVRAGTFGIDTAKIGAVVSKGAIIVREFDVARGTNHIAGTGRIVPASDNVPAAGEVQLRVQAPKLAEFGIATKGQTLDGQLDTTAQVKFAGKRIDGEVQLGGGTFMLGEFATRNLSGRVQMQGTKVQVEALTLVLNDHDQLSVQGHFDTAEPRRYDGTVAVGIKNLASLQPLLKVFGVKEPVRGALDVAWKGEGALDAKQHRGDAIVTLLNAKYGKQDIQELRLSGKYTEENASGELRATAGPTKLATQIVFAEQQIGLRDLELRQGEQRALTGELALSLARPDGEKLDPLRQPLRISLHADQLDLEKLLTSLGQTAPAGGKITLHLAATGTAARPELDLNVQGRALKAKAAGKFDPAEFDLALSYKPGALSLKASARQPLIQPLEITANAPVDLEKIIADKKLDPSMKFEAAVKLPPTSLAILPNLVPQVRRIDGTAAIDVRATGTVDKPVLNGTATVAIKSARLTDEKIPSIGQFDAQLAFDADTVKVTKVHGEVGGGTFDLLGKMELAQLDNPAFDLQLKANDVLVKRDDAITVRADADIKLGGNKSAGSVTGEVFITQSRFFKEIDILPIGLPGRPKPAPKSAPRTPDILLPPPLDQWKIDLAIKTRAEDPFLIRGNLANGGVTVNLRVGNTGATPWVEGSLSMEQFQANLPFSVLTVDTGNVYFTRNAPINDPTLDLRAQSKIRDYTVNAFIFGRASEPQIQFTSEPPLPHADIVSLLATGTTTSELAGNADVLASKAAILAVQSVWKKVFQRGKAAPPPPKTGDAGFRDRFELDLGALDNKTGAQEASARFKVNDQIYILGELDTRGGYTGSLKYLLRFR